MRTILAAALSLASSFNAHAGECDPVDLRSRFGPVRNQEEFATCYSFMAADLLGASVPGEPLELSAVHVAALYAKGLAENDARNMRQIRFAGRRPMIDPNVVANEDKQGHSFYDRIGGSNFSPFVIAKALEEKHLCLETELPSESRTLPPREKLRRSLLPRESRDLIREKIDSVEKALVPETVSVPPHCLAPAWFPGAPLPVPLPALSNRLRDWTVVEIAKSLSRECRLKFPMPERVVQVRDLRFTEEARPMRSVSEQLTRGAPVGLSYSVCPFLKNPGASGVPCGHASIVVARRPAAGGACEFLLRNSWGENCAAYREGIACEDGHFWVREDELAPTLRSYFWLAEPQNP